MVLDRNAVERAVSNGCPPLDHARFLALLNRETDALQEDFRLLADTPDRMEPLLVLAQVFQRSTAGMKLHSFRRRTFSWPQTRTEEANVRHHIGRRLFDEARYRGAAAEFQWASDLYRVSGQDQLEERSREARQRAREVHAKE
ncbi:hypothetical protein [Arthrobacter oryzae]|uniref:hypothetical protein n=1 Tax=Arthrobacter oryzae TaxID=409290 RepID=UPI00286657CA|nr:hypothetical protein [Arthrobacter oryzae]MDR6508388.1 hypothetical protein [Arthrobacter oryzae]